MQSLRYSIIITGSKTVFLAGFTFCAWHAIPSGSIELCCGALVCAGLYFGTMLATCND